jgi:ABC-type multidrug transport system fused ATPase/permease subunit
MKEVGKLRAFSFIFGFVRPYLPIYIIGMFLYTSQSLSFTLLHSVLLGGITSAMMNGDVSELLMAGLTGVLILILLIILVYPGVLINQRTNLMITRRLQTKIFRTFINAGAEKREHSGAQLAALNNDVLYAENIYGGAFSMLILSLLPIVTFSAAIFAIEWRIGLFTAFLGLLSLFGQSLFAKPLARLAEKKLEKIADATKVIGDVFSGGIIARVFSLQENMLSRFGRENDGLRRVNYSEARVKGAHQLFSGILNMLTTGGVFAVGSLLISNDQLTIPVLMMLVPMCSSVSETISSIGSIWVGLQAPLEAGRRVYTLLDGDNRLDPLPDEQPAAFTGERRGCAVEVKGLTFAYKDADSLTLKDVSLSVGENRLAAFVGESGSGKSTLLKVIAGLYGSGEARVSVGGVTLSYENIQEWRSNFAYVDQNSTLFNLTIAENIGLGKSGASMDEIKAAAAEANADGFIEALPQGYDTPVGEIGGSLSGGQRQRIAIARALIRRSPVLIFDEATSALDAGSEREVIETIHNLRKDHTILLITHNLPAIKPDMVFRIEEGELTLHPPF